jgi:hypothetical protein
MVRNGWMMENAEAAYRHARYTLKGRFIAGEPAIAQHPMWSYFYAANVIRRRFELGEPAIAQDAHYAYLYADEILNCRFPLSEDLIILSLPFSEYYFNRFNHLFTEHEKVLWLLKI